jgi:hypothetical protein
MKMSEVKNEAEQMDAKYNRSIRIVLPLQAYYV